MTAALNWEPDPINHTRICECGNEKPATKQACHRCTWLDGRLEKHALVIDALRGTDGLTVRELCLVVNHSATDSDMQSMYGTVQVLMGQGRVRRYRVENDMGEGGVFGGVTAGWVYALR